MTENQRPTNNQPQSKTRQRIDLSHHPIPLYIPNILCYLRIILSFVSLYITCDYDYHAYQYHPHNHHESTLCNNNNNNNNNQNNQNSYQHHFDQQQHKGPIFAVLLWILASLLDAIDGKLAIYLHQQSDLGILLDIIADNVLRATTWIASARASVLSSSAAPTLVPVPIIATLIISLEWLTFLSTQLQAFQSKMIMMMPSSSCSTNTSSHPISSSSSSNENDVCCPHWKQRPIQNKALPTVVQQVFRNNFLNPLGILCIYGMFGSGLLTYIHYHRWDFRSWWWLYLDNDGDGILWYVFRGIAYIGRLLGVYVEVWLCWDYFEGVVRSDRMRMELKLLELDEKEKKGN